MTQHYVLRPMSETDLDQVLAWRNHADIRGVMYTQHEITPQEHTRWFAQASQDPHRYLYIFEGNDKALGFVSLKIAAPGKIADWGFYLAPDAPAGSGRKLGLTTLQHAFGTLGLHKICGQVVSFNQPSIRFHRNLGFVQEGVLREQYFDGEEYHDVLHFGMPARHWQASRRMKIAGREISADQPPYIIAELSANHNGNIDTAREIIRQAKLAGADAVKLQTYTADTITLNSDADDFRIQGGLWDGKTLYELYQQAHMPWDWHRPLFDYARELGITIFSSPFDNTAVDLLESLDAPAYKIASFEAIDLPLIRYVASTGKPMIISTGMADADEIQEAIDAAREGGCRELAILHCVSGYPAPAEDYNLATLADMRERFGLLTGLSDHTLDNTTAISSVALGACIIEKHVTLDRQGGGPDDSFSLEPADLAALCRDSKSAWRALGKVNYARTSSEQGNVQFRRSLYFVKDMKAGDLITPDSIRSVRPGFGLPPKMLDSLLGQRLTRDVAKHTAVREEDTTGP